MNTSMYTENTLVQQTTAEYLKDLLGGEPVYAYNAETFGPDGLLGRKDDRDVVLIRYLCAALVELNPGLPVDSYSESDVHARAEDVFRHVYRVYPTVPSLIYEKLAAA